jgi:HEPN domain-containing protein
MTTDQMAEGYLRLAVVRADVLRAYYDAASWASVVREGQEAVELFLKGALRLVGVEPARTHDPGPALITEAESFPGWFQAHVHDLAFIATNLAGDRGASYYGDERNRIPPDRLFDQAAADRAIEQVRFVRDVCVRLAREKGVQGLA